MRRFRTHAVIAAAISALVSMGGLAAGAPAATAGRRPAGSAVTVPGARPALQVCGQGPRVTRPPSVLLACADHGEIIRHLTWTEWTATRATASGILTWREFPARGAARQGWGRASADIVLFRPVPVTGHGVLFTDLELHVTGPTPRGFKRDLTFGEAPLPRTPASQGAPVPPHSAVPGAPASPAASAPSGPAGYADIEGFWIAAGGSGAAAGSYTNAQIAAAITGAESSFCPGVIQQGQPYATTGWGLWQITPGNELPAGHGASGYGSDYQLLDPWNNAESAVSLFDARGFEPWTIYDTGGYENYLQHTAANTGVTDPGEYVQDGAAPPDTPSSPAAAPGSGYGPAMPGLPAPVTSPVAPGAHDRRGPRSLAEQVAEALNRYRLQPQGAHHGRQHRIA